MQSSAAPTDTGTRFGIDRSAGAPTLTVRADRAEKLVSFEGVAGEVAGGYELSGPLNAVNADALRAAMTALAPVPAGINRSVGTGDRLGVATPGHALAFRAYAPDVFPVFAQQSAREMSRLARSPQEVLDAATFGVLEAGWTQGFGADADHLTDTGIIGECVDAGFRTFTLDLCETVRPVGESATIEDLAAVPWKALETTRDEAFARHDGRKIPLGRRTLTLSEPAVARALAKYGAAIAHAVTMHRFLDGRATSPYEVEIAIDESEEVTSLEEHAVVVAELHRLGVRFVGFAPRYLGAFEKGVEYRGDLDRLRRYLDDHAALARALGPYKLSVHSGSDKFSIYPAVMDATDGLVHLKTSGTSYLVALRLVAQNDAELFRAIWAASLAAYDSARHSYPVSAGSGDPLDVEMMPDASLGRLLEEPAPRQILHVGYGSALRAEGRHTAAATALKELLMTQAPAYGRALAAHIGRHLRPFSRHDSGGIDPSGT